MDRMLSILYKQSYILCSDRFYKFVFTISPCLYYQKSGKKNIKNELSSCWQQLSRQPGIFVTSFLLPFWVVDPINRRDFLKLLFVILHFVWMTGMMNKRRDEHAKSFTIFLMTFFLVWPLHAVRQKDSYEKYRQGQ